jgi:hypothetical protein
MTPEDEKTIRGIIRDELTNVVWILLSAAVITMVATWLTR